MSDFRVLPAYLLEALVVEYLHLTELYLFKSKEINSLGQQESYIYFKKSFYLVTFFSVGNLSPGIFAIISISYV